MGGMISPFFSPPMGGVGGAISSVSLLPSIIARSSRAVTDSFMEQSSFSSSDVKLSVGEKKAVESAATFARATLDVEKAEAAKAGGDPKAAEKTATAARWLDHTQSLDVGGEKYALVKHVRAVGDSSAAAAAPASAKAADGKSAPVKSVLIGKDAGHHAGPAGAALWRAEGGDKCSYVLAFHGAPKDAGAAAPCTLGADCGKVDAAVRARYEGLQKEVLAELEAADKACPAGWNLTVTGHGAGGSLATFGFLDAILHSGLRPAGKATTTPVSLPHLKQCKAVTFGPSAVGDAGFARFFSSVSSSGGKNVSFDRVVHSSADKAGVVITQVSSDGTPLTDVGREIPTGTEKTGLGIFDSPPKSFFHQASDMVAKPALTGALRGYLCAAPGARLLSALFFPSACGLVQEDAEAQAVSEAGDRVHPYTAAEEPAAAEEPIEEGSLAWGDDEPLLASSQAHDADLGGGPGASDEALAALPTDAALQLL